MQIPPEEMAKFLEACGDKQAAARAAAQAGGGLGADNIGHKLLQKMGWKEGEGLGGQKHGTTKPIAAQGTAGGSGLGLGAAAHGAVEDGDDEYTRYRKRSEYAGRMGVWHNNLVWASSGVLCRWFVGDSLVQRIAIVQLECMLQSGCEPFTFLVVVAQSTPHVYDFNKHSTRHVLAATPTQCNLVTSTGPTR